MRPIAIGLTAALALAALIPAAVISAPKEKDKPAATVDAKAREAGMKAAPAIVQASGVSCTVTDARLIAADKKGATDYYEVACQQGLGFAVIAKKDVAPQTYSCLETSQPAADGKPGDLACILPGNANQKAGLAPYLAKANTACEIENARAIGAGNTSAYFEVACKGGSGYIVTTSSPVNIDKDVNAETCLRYETGTVSCKLTDRATQLAVIDTLASASAKKCVIKEKRYVLTTKTDNYFEVSCQDGKGYMLQQTSATGALANTIDCAQAGFIDGGCTLSDAVAAQTEQAGLYTKLSTKAGFDCKVEKYGMLPSKDPRTEIVELKCSNRPDGGIGLFSVDKNVVYDCLTAELNGYRCSYTKTDAVFPRLTADLKAMGKGSCTVSGSRVIGQTSTQGYVEVACSDGLPGWVLVYPLGQATPKPAELLSCLQAKGVGGGCKLPTNATKG